MNAPLEDTNVRPIPHRRANCTLVDVTSVSVTAPLLLLSNDSHPFGIHRRTGNAAVPAPSIFIFTCLFRGLTRYRICPPVVSDFKHLPDIRYCGRAVILR